MSRKLVAFDFGAVEVETGFIKFEARVLQFRAVKFTSGAAGDITIGDFAAAVGNTFLVEFVYCVEGFDAFAHVGGEAFEVTQGVELFL